MRLWRKWVWWLRGCLGVGGGAGTAEADLIIRHSTIHHPRCGPCQSLSRIVKQLRPSPHPLLPWPLVRDRRRGELWADLSAADRVCIHWGRQ